MKRILKPDNGGLICSAAGKYHSILDSEMTRVYEKSQEAHERKSEHRDKIILD